LETLKKSKKTKDIPVVIYTGKKLTSKDRSRLSSRYELLLQKTRETPDTLLKQLNSLVNKKIEIEQKELPKSRGEILLAEDDPSGQKLMKHLLNRMGYQVDLASTGKQVLDKLQKKDYHVVLMDMEMPEMDGFTATREIRKEKRYQDLPIIALTAHAMKEHKEKTFKAGCTDYLSKPVNRSKLEKLLEKYMPQIPIEKTEKAPPVKEEDEMMAELAKFFVSDLGQRIQQFDVDVSSRNKEEVVRFGHSLKGTAGSYGFPKFSSIGSHIEKEGMAEHWERIQILHKQLIEEYKLLGQ
jgi:CheY-like chemotaxis protein